MVLPKNFSMSLNKEHIRESLRDFLMKDHNLLILAALIGFLAGIASTVFRWMIHFFDSVFSEQGLSLIGISPAFYPFLLPLMPMIGGWTIGVICHYFPSAVNENGVHKVIHAVALKGGKIRKRTIITCATTSAITIGSGGSAGREGPTVQIGSAVGSAVGSLFHLSTERIQVLVGCGVAAGIAASFNAPLAGVLFSLEIILGDFAIHTFSPIIIASVIGTVTARALEGNEITFQVPFHQLVSYTEISFYMILGVLCAVVARGFTLTYFYIKKYFAQDLNIPPLMKPALGGLLVGIISIKIPEVLGNGYEAMELALTGNMFWGLALALVFLKILATSLTLGSGGLGGIFAPSLFMGAMVGVTFGTGIHWLFPNITATPETYAVVGMGAVAAAVMQAPLTCILMLFELTNDYTLILPIMVACIFSAFTYRGMAKYSIYIQYLLNEGINIKHGREVSILDGIKVKEVMNTEVTTIPEEMPFRKILETISYSKNFYFPVVNREGDMTSILSFNDVREVFFEEGLEDLLVAGELATKKVLFLRPDQNLNEATEMFEHLDVDQLPVVTGEDSRKVIGMLNRGDMVAAYNREVLVSEFDR
ncbi:MAG: chloride channel protein [Nitrospinaceae bacterium]|nr:MAG: chloride channel protein [Nitrospinaceae bacterium]